MLPSTPPEVYFVIVNGAWPSTRAALTSKGRFVSAAFEAMRDDPSKTAAYDTGDLDYRPYIENSDWVGRWSAPGRTVGLRYRLDHDAEIVRREHYPLSPSRFSAIFAFGDEGSCERAETELHWNPQDRRKFRLVPDPRNRVVCLNMHTYTAARNLYMTELDFSPSEREQLWLPYWEGKCPPSRPIQRLPEVTRPAGWSTPLWEYLIDGELELVC